MVRNTRYIREKFSRILKVAYSDSVVLLSGERDTEKVYISELIHALSDRDKAAFISLDCSAGSFDPDHPEEYADKPDIEDLWPSLRRQALGGSVFIDGIDCLNRRGQFYLKSILEKEQTNLRRREALNLPTIRFILGGSDDLGARVCEGTFLPELYYTMMVIEIVIPPIRDRRDDIIPLARMILNSSPGGIGFAFDLEAKEVLVSYDWPGNFDELKGVLDQAIKESQDGWITGRSLINKIGQNFRPPEALNNFCVAKITS